jgi:cold-inducible RNA-binding protein
VSKRLYVGNLSYSVSEDELLETFLPYGATEATIPIDEAGRSKGFGFVEVEDEQAQVAIEALNGKEHRGRTLTVNEARPRPERRGGFGGGGYGGGGGYDRGGGGRRW